MKLAYSSYRKLNPENTNKVALSRIHRLRNQLMIRLGRQCAKCGDTNPFHLQIDHIHNDGNIERQGKRKTSLTPSLIIKYLNGEKDITRLQILCANCNYEKQIRRYEHYSEFLEKLLIEKYIEDYFQSF